jgi:hypothetical protein
LRSIELDEEIEIERSLLQPAVLPDQIRRYERIVQGQVWVLYPFDEQGIAIDEQDLFGDASIYPVAAKFLRRIEPKLKCIKADRKVPQWYAPAGTRVNEPWHNRGIAVTCEDEMVLFPRFSLMPEVALAPTNLIPLGATRAGVIRRGSNLTAEMMLVLMNSALFNWYAAFTTPAFGRSGKFDRSKLTTRGLRVPSEAIGPMPSHSRELVRALLMKHQWTPAQILLLESQLDDWVFDLYRIGEVARRSIKKELAHYVGNQPYLSARDRSGTGSAADRDYNRVPQQ